jgi:transposase
VLGDRRVWRVVRVPSVPEEDVRQLHRTWETAQQDRTRLVNRLKGLLATLGVQVLIDGTLSSDWRLHGSGMERRYRTASNRGSLARTCNFD